MDFDPPFFRKAIPGEMNKHCDSSHTRSDRCNFVLTQKSHEIIHESQNKMGSLHGNRQGFMEVQTLQSNYSIAIVDGLLWSSTSQFCFILLGCMPIFCWWVQVPIVLVACILRLCFDLMLYSHVVMLMDYISFPMRFVLYQLHSGLEYSFSSVSFFYHLSPKLLNICFRSRWVPGYLLGVGDLWTFGLIEYTPTVDEILHFESSCFRVLGGSSHGS